MKGTYTAIITPFDEKGMIDFNALEILLKRQKNAGISGIIVAGTTGEGATLSNEETKELFSFVKQKSDGMELVAGTGTNSTVSTIKNTEIALNAGIEKVLVVTPYYNKPSCKGLFEHYNEVASIGAKIVLYNVPGRTALNVAPKCLKRLSEIKNIVAVKEASGDISRLIEYQNEVSDRFDFLTGDDFTVVPFISMGGKGVISVFTNIFPEFGVKMVDLALNGNFKEASKMQIELLNLNRAMFMETNPLPVKTAVSMMGLCKEIFRKPLATMEDETRKNLEQILINYEII